MRSVKLFRKGNAVRVLRSFWDSSRTQKFGRTSTLDDKDQECVPLDPYQLNYSFSECDQQTKVTVIGAAGRVGKTLSLLLKTCPLIDHLCLFDTDKSVKGVGVDISHIDTKCSVSYVYGMRNIKQALDAPDVVIIAAGCPTSPNLNNKKLFERNAPVVASLSEACARFCPKACIVLITSPINSLLPVVGGVYEIIANRIPSRKLFGLTTLDVVRANTFVAEAVRKDPNSVIVPVIGGTSQETLVPVISQMKPCCRIKKGEMVALTECLKRAEGNLVDCQNCGTRGASSLSTAYAGFRFTTSLVMALKGAENIIECAFVKSNIIPELEYLASPLKLGVRGIEYNFGYPPLSDVEELLEDKPTGKEKQEASMRPYGTLGLLRNSKNFQRQARGYHTMTKQIAQDSEVMGKIHKRDLCRSNLMEDRKKSLMPFRQKSGSNNLIIKYKPSKFQSSLRKNSWNEKSLDKYKDLNAAAKQKFRSFYNQKKFIPSASALFLQDKKSAVSGKTLEVPAPEPKKAISAGSDTKITNYDKDEDEGSQKFGEKQLMVMREREKYRVYIYTQLQELRKENEKLKRRLVELSQDKNIDSALSGPNDDLELERTKLRACWLIMSSTMDAFSAFCKKFISKTDNQLLEATKELHRSEEQEEEEETYDAPENGENSSQTKNYDKKYLRFLEKLMEDEVESHVETEKRSHMSK